MDAALKKQGITFVVAGLAIAAIAPLAGGLVESAAIRHAASFAAPFGSLLFLYGCVRIARAKDQPWYYGLLGLFSCIGLAVLWFVIPDKHKA